MQTLQKPRRGGRPRGFHLDCALAQRAKSLLRRAGDRCRSARENWSLLSNMPELASGRPGRPYAGQARPKGVLLACRERKSVSVRAPWEIIPDKLIVYRVDFLLRRGARDFSLHFATQTLQKPRRGGRPRGFHLDCALAQRLKSLLRRAGDRCRSARENWSLLSNMLELASGRPGRPYAGQARPKGVLLAIRARKQSLAARGRKLGLLGNKLRRPCAGGGRKRRN